MDNYNIRQNNKELSGEAFEYFMLSFIKNRNELNNWKNKAVLGFYSSQSQNPPVHGEIKYLFMDTIALTDDVIYGMATMEE